MYKAVADILLLVRGRAAQRLAELTPEQWLAQPAGFVNNIAWNVGHLVMAQQGLCYARFGLEPPVGHEKMAEMRVLYGGGTSPADWTETPDTDELQRLFVDLAQQMSDDIAAGKLDNLTMPEPVDGRFAPPESTMHGLIYNQSHEGLHIGTIGELIGFMNSTTNE